MAADYKNEGTSGGGRGYVSILDFKIGDSDDPELIQFTPKEILLGESLLTPGLQTVVTAHSAIYIPPGKDFDKLKGKDISFTLEWTEDGADEATKSDRQLKIKDNHVVYRMDNRKFHPVNTGGVEEFSLHATDKTMLNDAKKLVSKSWKCTKPSEIVEKMLDEVEAKGKKVEKADPARDYIAENIHPFQVIAQQSNVALADGDPSFIHFMTYPEGKDGKPTHHFESLKSLCKGKSVQTFKYSETGLGIDGNDAKGHYGTPEAILSFQFPCDWDQLADILNGINEQGQNKNSGSFLDQAVKKFGGMFNGGDAPGFNMKEGLSNKESGKDRDSCNLDVETHLLKRQARMSLLERDKIALRIVVPWNPLMHAGKIITLEWKNKYKDDKDVYGHGDYLILNMTHTIRYGGFSTTTMDCVSQTVGGGTT
jgi:hypothetical protein